MYSFFDGWVPIDPHKAQASGIPVQTAKLIDKANSHPRFLSILGILPNQLRTLLGNVSDDVNKILKISVCHYTLQVIPSGEKDKLLLEDTGKKVPQKTDLKSDLVSLERL